MATIAFPYCKSPLATVAAAAAVGITTSSPLLILLLLCLCQQVAHCQFLNDASRREPTGTTADGQVVRLSAMNTTLLSADTGQGSGSIDAETLLQEKLEQIKKMQLQHTRIETQLEKENQKEKLREPQKPQFVYQTSYQTIPIPAPDTTSGGGSSIIRPAQLKQIAQLIETYNSPKPEMKLKDFQPNPAPVQVVSSSLQPIAIPTPSSTTSQRPSISTHQQQQSQAYSNYNQLYLGHNPFIEILRPLSYADDNIVTLNLSHSHIYEIDSEAFVGQRFEYIDLSNNKLGLIHSRSFRIGPNHSRHTPYNPSSGIANTNSNINKTMSNNSTVSKSLVAVYPSRRPPPSHPKSVTIDFSHNPAIVALSGAFDYIDVPNCLLNFTNSTVELKFGAFKKYFKEHPGHIVDVESVDCCEQEWLLGYKHNFVARTHCEHDPSLYLSKVSQQTIIDSCIAYVTSARHSMTIQGPSIIHQVVAAQPGGLKGHHSSYHSDSNQQLTYLILGGTAMVLTSLSIYIIFYMFSLKAAFVYQMQNKS